MGREKRDRSGDTRLTSEGREEHAVIHCRVIAVTILLVAIRQTKMTETIESLFLSSRDNQLIHTLFASSREQMIAIVGLGNIIDRLMTITLQMVLSTLRVSWLRDG
jgi:hypothetical protein